MVPILLFIYMQMDQVYCSHGKRLSDVWTQFLLRHHLLIVPHHLHQLYITIMLSKGVDRGVLVQGVMHND